ncbi:MAG: four helix bundle protein [Bacteroidetes bacterium]|nr:four helix bundle protein [Bacteroidota bacterium]
MSLCYDLPVYRETYKLLLEIFLITKDFPREYKYTIGQDMKRDALELLRGIYRANKSKEKKEELEATLENFEILKLEIRLCSDLKILPVKKQATLAGSTESIGKQMISWKNASQKNKCNE